MKVFFDTSAFVKLYINEVGSHSVIKIYQDADALALSVICFPEIVSTLCQLAREGKISIEEYKQLRKLISIDLKNIEIVQITPKVLSHVVSCLENHPLRAMDAIHLGCALTYSPDQFVSSDRKQIQAAYSIGLTVVEV